MKGVATSLTSPTVHPCLLVGQRLHIIRHLGFFCDEFLPLPPSADWVSKPYILLSDICVMTSKYFILMSTTECMYIHCISISLTLRLAFVMSWRYRYQCTTAREYSMNIFSLMIVRIQIGILVIIPTNTIHVCIM